MRHIIVISLFIFSCVPAAAASSACPVLESEITELLNDRSCSEDSDCAAMQFPPPFGCNRYVNKTHTAELENLYAAYNRECGPFLFNCLAHSTRLRCEQGVCRGRVSLAGRFPSISTLDEHGRPLR